MYPSDVRSVPLAPAEERVLRKLLDGGPCSVAAVKPRPVAARLLELGLVMELPRARGRKVAQLELSDDGFATYRSFELVSQLAVEPRMQALPYLGDYTRLVAVGRTFYGAFSSSNLPDSASFPNGVVK